MDSFESIVLFTHLWLIAIYEYAKVGDKIDLWLQLKILTYCRPSVWEKWQSAWQIDGDYGEKSIISGISRITKSSSKQQILFCTYSATQLFYQCPGKKC